MLAEIVRLVMLRRLAALCCAIGAAGIVTALAMIVLRFGVGLLAPAVFCVFVVSEVLAGGAGIGLIVLGCLYHRSP